MSDSRKVITNGQTTNTFGSRFLISTLNMTVMSHTIRYVHDWLIKGQKFSGTNREHINPTVSKFVQVTDPIHHQCGINSFWLDEIYGEQC